MREDSDDSLQATVLFDSPHTPLASTLQEHISECENFQVVTGFATVEGIRWLMPALGANPSKLECLIVGAGTQRAFDAIDAMVKDGVPSDHIYVHLGHGRESRGKLPFFQYHPMLHSKVYFFDMPHGVSAAIIGSNNLTGFALGGQNGEAAVHLIGPSTHPELLKVRQHITACRDEAVTYLQQEKEAYVWWLKEFLRGLSDKVGDRPREFENQRTLIVLCENSGRDRPRHGDTIYFDLPHEYHQRATGVEAHLYFFDPIPADPEQALASLSSAQFCVTGKVSGLSERRKVTEIKPEWQLTQESPPKCLRVQRVRPDMSSIKQQMWLTVSKPLHTEYLYLFDVGVSRWLPILDKQHPVHAPDELRSIVRDVETIPPEHEPYFRVSGLKVPKEEVSAENEWYSIHSSPSGGHYILLSPRRARIPRIRY